MDLITFLQQFQLELLKEVKFVGKLFFLDQPAVEPNQQDQIVPPQQQKHTSPPSQRKDGWLEIKLGEYFNEEGKDYELQIRLLEGDSRQWKRGLIVEGIEIRPTKG